MRKFLKSILGDPSGGEGESDEAALRHATAALLIEAAQMDNDFDAVERETIERLLRTQFEMTETELQALIEKAAETQADSHQILPFTREIKNQFDEAERLALIEMLWEVVYADGEVHDYEANLLRRIAGLIYVSDRDCGAARKRVAARLKADGA